MDTIPRLPLEASIDLTYRCNNDCRHCWLRIAPGDPKKKAELSFDDIRGIVDEARSLGCRRWSISGGEPMLHGDFEDIFDYITSRAISYSLNTNGTLITPRIAQMMRRKGNKMVALYGATAKVHDHVTRTPGSYEATMEGFRRLQEAGAGFTVQLIPMRDNWREFGAMEELAKSLSKHYRIGAPWLYCSASGDEATNREIRRQRLDAKDVIAIDLPDASFKRQARSSDHSCGTKMKQKGEGLFAGCIETRRDFHVDPYGGMSFCSFIKDPDLRYDLRQGSVEECWERFIPSLADKAPVDDEYLDNCGSCELKSDCRICPVYSYLEHRRYGARLSHLCDVARENRRYKEEWMEKNRNHFFCGGVHICVESDIPMDEGTFHPKLQAFRTDEPGVDTVSIRHHFGLPDLEGKNLGKRVYNKAPWSIYRSGSSWIYLGISPTRGEEDIHRVAVFNDDHTEGRIYNDSVREDSFRKGGLQSLTLFPTDQILLARLIADREGCYLHSAGLSIDGEGVLFAGHSGAGKSTTCELFRGHAEILCDDRNILRPAAEGDWRVYGTWSHGTVPDVSSDDAPLKAIVFINQAKHNAIEEITDRREKVNLLLENLIRPFETKDWWEKTLDVLERLSREVPCYRMHFDRSGGIVQKVIEEIVRNPQPAG